MDPFQRRRVGRSSVELPGLGFGGVHLGELYSLVPESEAQATLEGAWQQGVRFFDTAPAYALQFPLAHPAVASVIPGAVSEDQVRQNVAAIQADIPNELWSDLKNEGLLVSNAPVPEV